MAMAEVPEPIPSPARVRVCRKCRYALTGLAARGQCPECGTRYPPVAGDDKSQMTAGEMCFRLLWPVAGFALCLGLIGLASLGTSGEGLALLGLLGSGVMILATIVNTPLQIAYLARRHAPPGQASGSYIAHLASAGKVWVSIATVLTVSPLVFFGACLYVLTR